MARFAQGYFVPKNPQKYIGNKKITYRSGWELVFFRFLDESSSVINWASESIRIPYRNPVTGKQSIYVPDVFMVYVNKNGKTIAELIEIKPSSQTSLQEARSNGDKIAAIVNQAKWKSASQWCSNQSIGFRIVTERDLFHTGNPSNKKRRR